MRSIEATGAIAVLMLTAAIARAGTSPQVGDMHEITLTSESQQHGSNGTSGSSNDRDTIVEKVIGVRADGLELEYDLPKTVSADERQSDWQFPFRVFKPSGGQPQLLNGPELEARIDGWLKAAGWTRAVCGHWVFTWTALRIECDPQSVLNTVRTFDLGAVDLREGGSYQDPEARSPGTWTWKTTGPDGTTFTAEMPVDPDAARRARAQADVVAGEIMHRPVTLDAALQQRAKETISGTISVAFETDPAGAGRRRTKLTKLNIEMPDGRSETRTVMETLERRAISGRD